MPTIVGDLKGISLMNWVFSVYLLTMTLATPVYGKLVDEIGRKPVFITGLFIFLVGSISSGLSSNMPELIFWRAIQGIGAGAILPISNTIIADIYTPEKRAQIMGLNNSAWGIASVAAPLLGGVIVDNFSWHWIFFINIPIGLLSIILIFFFLKEAKHSGRGKLDIIGTLWLSLAIGGILYGVELLNQAHVKPLTILSVFACALLGLVLFTYQEKRAQDPIILLDLFKNRTFVIQNFAAAMLSIFLIAFDVYVPSWTQGLLGLPATIAGFATTPSSVLWTFGSFVAGLLLPKFTPRQILMIGMGLLVAAGSVFIFLPVTTPFYVFMFIGIFLGTGFGITVTCSMIVSQNIVDQRNIGMATSFNTLVRTLSQSISISVFGIILNRSLLAGIKNHPEADLTGDMFNKMINPHTVSQLPDSLIPLLHQIYHTGLHNIFLIATICMALVFILNLLKQKDYHIDTQ